MSSLTAVHVPHPLRMIVFTPAELSDLVSTPAMAEEPGVEWQSVGRVLSRVSEALSTPPSFRRSYDVTVRLPRPLTGRERIVVETWMLPGIAPTLDTIDLTMHGKLGWLAGAAAHTDLLPVRLALFDEITRTGLVTADARRRVSDRAQLTLERLPTEALWRSPLAAASLRRLAEGASTDMPETTRAARRARA